MRGDGVGTLRAASEENTGVIISRESHESRKILLYAFGGIGVICVSKLRTLHADVPTLTAHRSLLKTQKLVLLFFCQKSKSAVICRICVISVPMKILYKTEFVYKSSRKVESAQLENFYFPVRKLIFSSWKVKISQ